MIIIADGGSTKTNWCLLDDSNKKIYFNTEGYNPYFVDSEYIVNSLRKGLPNDLPFDEIKEVNYYGAGVHNKEKAEIVIKAIQEVFQQAQVEVGHDLLAAARALLGTESGFAAILGTGTNSCIYDGNDITYNIDSCAYILGDEGSGSYIGKKLLTDYIRDLMPQDVRKVFYDTYKITPDEIMDTVYTKPLANRFCASFSKFVYDNNVNIEYTRAIVDDAFEAFFKNLVSKYPNYQEYTFNCIGSVGYNFRNVLEEKAVQYGMKVGKILRSPIDDLVQFHINRASK
ncbi:MULTISPECIES: N-acetylglucosamine kinase [Sphingobacterium]|uniref:N-acetylglucosamine kinase n=1 Tax=Sphingobacterium kitahiroshimense TaxID=470446 RepID=A0ABV0C0K4_9SPHI|nr:MULTISPECIES: N-acetylglucosamine kinase [Sphingobacterium]KKX49453.1 N-acetylglucosamine kinase [Sphingobacterium sp. IITKGP-BTPF85]MBB2952428.1 N-acetylglucosamine kinase-like BadF-type ATPase [Sphingobacterium sp. JUb56]MCS3557334.1 N-acetylglucosamine kinase-like BadF-type ATPase [Sphingobacterium sp. JUb21]MCW2260886.1 N-acetylglucosamine kinase-like BadF-type ATPase [Sphingobacterium kitahiroshimense]NJI76460.1 N-acetylglucosamine kinase [Sphingobacterium sp. B16(2022)]